MEWLLWVERIFFSLSSLFGSVLGALFAPLLAAQVACSATLSDGTCVRDPQ